MLLYLIAALTAPAITLINHNPAQDTRDDGCHGDEPHLPAEMIFNIHDAAYEQKGQRNNG